MGIQRIFTRHKQKLGEVERKIVGGKSIWIKTGAYQEIKPKSIMHPRHKRLLKGHRRQLEGTAIKEVK